MLHYIYVACLVILWFLHCVVLTCSNISGEHIASIFGSHWLHKSPIPSSLFHSCDLSNFLKWSYVNTFPPLNHFRIHLGWFSHCVNKDSTFLWNIKTCICLTVQKCKRWISCEWTSSITTMPKWSVSWLCDSKDYHVMRSKPVSGI
jgi:hypothetical protein